MKILNVPNILTLSRLFSIPIILTLIYSNNATLSLIAVVLFVMSSFTDQLDGYIARKYNLTTTFGIFFDPIVDKILILSMFFLLVDLRFIPLWMVLIFLFREFLVTGIRQVGSLKGKIVGANWMGKTKATLQIILITFAMILITMNKFGKTIIYGNEVIYFGTLLLLLVTVIFTSIFVKWNLKLLLN